jgi:acyl CoA:acetate/3-ketoacid CoA transferase
VTLPLFVDFVDPSAKAACDRLEIDILLDAGAWGSIHRTVTGFKAGGACQTSGTLDLTDQWDRFWQAGLTISVKITLTNALGHKSNELTGSFQS